MDTKIAGSSSSSFNTPSQNGDVQKKATSIQDVKFSQSERPLRSEIEDGNNKFSMPHSDGSSMSNHSIAVVSSAPTKPLNPQCIASIVDKNNEIAKFQEKKNSLKQDYLNEKRAIAKVAKEEIEHAKTKANSIQSRALMTGAGSSLIAGGDAERAKKTALEKINKDAARNISRASFEYAQKLLSLEKSCCSKLLEKRFIRASSFSTEQQIQLATSLPQDEKILKALDLKQQALDFLGENLEHASQEDFELVSQVFSTANTIFSITFAENADQEITRASHVLKEVPNKLNNLLNSVAHRGLLEKEEFSPGSLIKEFHELCENSYARFQFAQTVSDREAGAIAEKNASMLLKRAGQLKIDAENLTAEIPFATQENQKNLQKKAQTLLDLAAILEETALAYDQIADACVVELREVPQLKGKLEEIRNQTNDSSLLKKSTVTASKSGTENTDSKKEVLRRDLFSLVEQTDSAKITTPETVTLAVFLSQLEEITDRDDHAITAFNNKILLSPIPSPFPVDADRQPYMHGIHLIRLALFREFGRHGLQRFDQQFAANIQAETPIRLGKLKKFLEAERSNYKNSSSYFISENHSIEELLELKEDSPEIQKIIKADSSIASFNPFLTSSTARDILDEETDSVQRGIDVVKITLKSFFENEPLLQAVQIKTILRNFDATFDATDPNKQLTVGKLKTFIEQELKRALAGMSFVEWLSSEPKNPGVNAIIWRIITAGTLSVLTSLPQLSPIIKFCILVSEQSTSDQTALWRAQRNGSTLGEH